jgi:hypothetical protein
VASKPKAKSRARARARPGSSRRGRGWRDRLSLLTPSRAWLDPWLLAAFAALLLAELEAHVWLAGLLSELRLQLGLLHVLGAAVALAFRRIPRGALLLLCACAWCAPLWPYLRAARPTPQHGPALRLVQEHVAGAALSAPALGRWLANERPDVLSLTGLTPGAAATLMRGAASSRHNQSTPRCAWAAVASSSPKCSSPAASMRARSRSGNPPSPPSRSPALVHATCSSGTSVAVAKLRT